MSQYEYTWKHICGTENIFFHHGTTNMAGVAIAFCKGDPVIRKSIADKYGCYLILEVEIFEEIFVLANIHRYHDTMTSPVMISAFFEDIASLHIDEIIIGGDFNVGLEYEDTTSDAIHCPRVAEHIKWYMHEWNLTDIWRVFNPTKKCFTRYIYTRSQAQKGQATGNRIDFFLTSQEFTLHTKDVNILPSFKTDHAMPMLTLSKTDKASYLPIWHFPSFVLDKKTLLQCLGQNCEGNR